MNIQDIRVGDRLLDGEGKTVRITAVGEQRVLLRYGPDHTSAAEFVAWPHYLSPLPPPIPEFWVNVYQSSSQKVYVGASTHSSRDAAVRSGDRDVVGRVHVKPDGTVEMERP